MSIDRANKPWIGDRRFTATRRLLHGRIELFDSLMMILHLALLAAASPAAAAVVLDVSPGTDILHSVLDARRAQTSAELAEPLTLRLASGIHRLTRPLEITPDHGLLHFEGQGDATISGGVPVTGWVKAGGSRWKAPIPIGFNSTGIGARMQMWRGDTRLTLARSPVLTYVHANASAIIFKGTDIAPTYHVGPIRGLL
jgi:hypothetical protein